MEHALPVPQLYDDVLTLFALSGTGSTPTHIVNYGGAFGEQAVWATHDVPNDPKYVALLYADDILPSIRIKVAQIYEARHSRVVERVKKPTKEL